MLVNPKPSLNNGAPISVTGELFDCSSFVENGPGILEAPSVVYDNQVTGDTTAVLQADN